MQKELEKHLHKSLVKYLKEKQQEKEFIFFHVKNDVGGRQRNFFYDLKPLGILPGVSDFVFLKKDGRCAFLEIKTKKGRLSENQKRFIEDAKKLGHDVAIAYGWNEILEKVEKIIE